MVKNDEEPYVRGEALVFLNQIGNRVDVNNVAASVVLLDSDSAPRSTYFIQNMFANCN